MSHSPLRPGDERSVCHSAYSSWRFSRPFLSHGLRCLDPISNLLGAVETFQNLAMPFSLEVSGCFSTLACPGHDRFDEKGTKVTSNILNAAEMLNVADDLYVLRQSQTQSIN